MINFLLISFAYEPSVIFSLCKLPQAANSITSCDEEESEIN